MYKILASLTLLILVPADSKVLDLDFFSLQAPDHWVCARKGKGVDSYVGKIAIGKGDTLEFDYGFYSNPLNKGNDYEYSADTISGCPAKICIPKKDKKGFTGIYFANTCQKYPDLRLTISGYNLRPENQKAFLIAAKTLTFKEW